MSLAMLKSLKVKTKTAIPTGTYPVKMLFSPKHDMVIPHIMDVPAYDAIEMHWGNEAKDTDGCPLTGVYNKANKDFIGHSVDTYKNFMAKLLPIIQKEEVFITIE
jgi:hypothetical protein